MPKNEFGSGNVQQMQSGLTGQKPVWSPWKFHQPQQSTGPQIGGSNDPFKNFFGPPTGPGFAPKGAFTPGQLYPTPAAPPSPGPRPTPELQPPSPQPFTPPPPRINPELLPPSPQPIPPRPIPPFGSPENPPEGRIPLYPGTPGNQPEGRRPMYPGTPENPPAPGYPPMPIEPRIPNPEPAPTRGNQMSVNPDGTLKLIAGEAPNQYDPRRAAIEQFRLNGDFNQLLNAMLQYRP